MSWIRAAVAIATALILAAVAVSGGSPADPRTPAALPGLPPPFLGVAVVGDGGLTAAIDTYGDVVDLQTPGPAGKAATDNSIERQRAETVTADTGIVPRVSVGGGPAQPLWQADWVRQSYLPATNVVRTEARFGQTRIAILDAAQGDVFERAISLTAPGDRPGELSVGVNLEEDSGVDCAKRWRDPRHLVLVCSPAGQGAAPETPIVASAVRDDRRWIAGARPLGEEAPGWARRMYARSLLALRALTDSRTGAAAAGIRHGWAYVWPRDAGAVAIALQEAGYREEARRVARFLMRLDLAAAARFGGDGSPVAGRAAQGDAVGWALAAADATGLGASQAPGLALRPQDSRTRSPGQHDRNFQPQWRDLADYHEKSPGDYLGNAIASLPSDEAIRGSFGTPHGLMREARGGETLELDSVAAWAVRPFPHPGLFPLVRRSLLHLLQERRSRYGIPPSEDWPEDDPWTAPTAWSAWSLAALGERRLAIGLLGDLRRAATPAGLLPERVDARNGIPRSTTPLAWSHAFTVLALRQLWPGA